MKTKSMLVDDFNKSIQNSDLDSSLGSSVFSGEQSYEGGTLQEIIVVPHR